MSSIQWFPGHMLTARKNAVETMEKVDVVIEVLDARVPFSSCNPMVETLRRLRQRPALKILNKADLADPHRTRAWVDYYNAQPGVTAVVVSAKSVGDVGRIPEQCLALAPHRNSIAKPLRMMIMGVPNVGKSTIMNALLKKRVAPVGDEPAITKLQKRLALSDRAVLIDTPGMLWPRIAPESALKLAESHSIGRNAYSSEDVAADLGDYLLADYRTLVTQRFGDVPEGCTGVGLVEWIAESRALLLQGGVLDLEKAALVLLNDFRSGTIGRITLETPEQVGARPEPTRVPLAARPPPTRTPPARPAAPRAWTERPPETGTPKAAKTPKRSPPAPRAAKESPPETRSFKPAPKPTRPPRPRAERPVASRAPSPDDPSTRRRTRSPSKRG